MNAVEDRIRAAMRAAADTVAPGTVAPLCLPVPSPSATPPKDPVRRDRALHGRARHHRAQRRAHRNAGYWRWWSGWLSPVAIAAALFALLAGLQEWSQLVVAGAGRGTMASAEGLPRYSISFGELRKPVMTQALSQAAPGTMTLTGMQSPALVEAYIEAAGMDVPVATISAPGHGVFLAATTPTDDRTFYLAVEEPAPPRTGPPRRPVGYATPPPVLRFFRASLNPWTGLVKLTQLITRPAAFSNPIVSVNSFAAQSG
ncbi:MAG TPA: hypothetical protein VGS19_13050 [Streptosporangiaceae bacterium]|nr:hypothetical protein [Streptosporangiaceae bacterium]